MCRPSSGGLKRRWWYTSKELTCATNIHEQRSLKTKNWHMQFENIEHYGSAGSEMKPFLVQLITQRELLEVLLLLALCITLFWRCGCRLWGWFWEEVWASTAATMFANS